MAMHKYLSEKAQQEVDEAFTKLEGMTVGKSDRGVAEVTLALSGAVAMGLIITMIERFDALEKKLDEMEKRLATKIVVWS